MQIMQINLAHKNYNYYVQILKHYQKDLVRGLMKKFMLYATGRQPDIDDLEEIEEIMKQNVAKGYPLKDMLLEVFQTDAFLAN